jgi:hypothetical protein
MDGGLVFEVKYSMAIPPLGAKTNKKRTTYLLTPPIKEISDTITMALRTYYSLRNVFALVHY